MSEMLLSTCLNAELLYQQRKAPFSSLLAQTDRLLKFRKGSQNNMNSNGYFTQTSPQFSVWHNSSPSLRNRGDEDLLISLLLASLKIFGLCLSENTGTF